MKIATFEITGIIDTQMALSFNAWARDLQRGDSASILIDSEGGGAKSALEIIAGIADLTARGVNVQSQVINAGSCAAVIASSCPKCSVEANGGMLFHGLSIRADKSKDIQLRIEAKRLESTFSKLLAARTGTDQSIFCELFEGGEDARLSAKEAVEYGFADSIFHEQSTDVPKVTKTVKHDYGFSHLINRETAGNGKNYRVNRPGRVGIATTYEAARLEQVQQSGHLECLENGEWRAVSFIHPDDACPMPLANGLDEQEIERDHNGKATSEVDLLGSVRKLL